MTDTEIFPWNDNFVTGFPEIDSQHRRLVDLLNRLVQCVAYSQSPVDVLPIFDQLADYALYHFSSEEHLWQQYLGDDAIAVNHNHTHEKFVAEITAIRNTLESRDIREIMDEVISFLTHWLAFHILHTDKYCAQIVLALQKGASLTQAKKNADIAMSGAMRVLIDTVLKMYDSLSAKTLELMREMAERQRAEEKLKLSRKVIENTQDAIFVTDCECRLIDTNPAFCTIVQRSHESILGLAVQELLPHLFCNDQKNSIMLCAAEKGHWSGEVVGRNAKNQTDAVWFTLSAIKDKNGLITHFAGIISSITPLIEKQFKLSYAADHDILTGLPNRRLLKDRMAQAISRCKRSGRSLAICFMDLDGFKKVNDDLGHEAGDEVLQSVAERLTECLRETDTVARLGGDEFVLLLEDDFSHQNRFELLMQRVLQSVAQPISLKDSEIRVSCSIGVTLYPADNSGVDDLLLHADQTMYQVKNQGKSAYRLYGVRD
jgi:diguanylate cyclase (GGDEF)-like protein/hemerythrin-like metal-binding protein/PAS domain S-box-containing protein